MDAVVKEALERGGVIDITTTGAKTGKTRRIEINFHHLDGQFFITGFPGRKRDWLANLNANPEFTVHLKRGLRADVEAEAVEIRDDDGRAEVLYRILTESWDNEPAKAEHILPRWVDGAPLVEFTVA
jgi:deazaflavin-dependent oxidoreductase (nitroreductase family)